MHCAPYMLIRQYEHRHDHYLDHCHDDDERRQSNVIAVQPGGWDCPADHQTYPPPLFICQYFYRHRHRHHTMDCPSHQKTLFVNIFMVNIFIGLFNIIIFLCKHYHYHIIHLFTCKHYHLPSSHHYHDYTKEVFPLSSES